MRKAPCYSTGGGIKGEPKKPVKSTIDRSKYAKELAATISGEGTNVVGTTQDSFTPEVLKNMGYNYVSGTMGGKDIVYEKGGNYHIYNEQLDNPENKYGLINIGNPFAAQPAMAAPSSTVIQNQPPTPQVDPNHKPLDFSNPSLIYDPNTGNYKNNVTGKFIEPLVRQYKDGGKVKPLAKYYPRHYAFGTPEEGVQPPTVTPQYPLSNSSSIQTTNTSGYGGSGSLGFANAIASANNIGNTNNENQKNNNQNSGTGKKFVNQTGTALGAYGTGYFGSQQNEDKGEDIRAKALAGIGQTGPIGGVISGAAAIGDNIGKPIKERAEMTDNEGNLVDEKAARRNALIGGLFSPSKALATRNSYEGGWTDITGKKYAAHLESQAKEEIAKKQAVEAERTRLLNEGRTSDAITARNLGELNYSDNYVQDTQKAKNAILNKLNSSGYSFSPFDNAPQNTPKVNPLTQARTTMDNGISGGGGSFKKGIRAMFAEGGVIKGAGTPKSDSIKANILAGSHIIPAENVGIAKVIKKEVLGKDPNKKANLNQASGEPVKVSTEEFVFTPDEKEQLEAAGIDLNELSPLAQSATAFKDGGPTPEKAREILKDGTIYGKKISDRQRRFFGYISNKK